MLSLQPILGSRLAYPRRPAPAHVVSRPSRGSLPAGRQALVLAAAGPKDEPEGGDPIRKQEWNLLLDLIVRYPAVRGTIAVLLGYLAHVSPLSTLHWSSGDALLGLEAALPLVLLEAFIMLPSWDPPRTTRPMKLVVPRGVAERIKLLDSSAVIAELNEAKSTSAATQQAGSAARATAGAAAEAGAAATAAAEALASAVAVAARPRAESSGAGASPSGSVGGKGSNGSSASGNGSSSGAASAPPRNDLVEVERSVTVRGEQHPLRDALYRTQLDRTLNNVGAVLSLPAEAVLLALVHLSEEMLYRGLLLFLAAGWVTDRLFEAGADDIVTLVGGLQVPTVSAGPALAAIGMTVSAVALVVQRQMFPLRLMTAAQKPDKEKGTEKGKGGASDTDAEKKVEQIATTLAQVRQGVVRQQRWTIALSAVDEGVQWASLSAAFLLTGNLLAPLVGSVAADALFSTWQRVKLRDMKQRRRLLKDDLTGSLKRTGDLAKAVRQHRMDKLAPPKASKQQSAPKEEGPAAASQGSEGEAASSQGEGTGAGDSATDGPPKERAQE